MKLRCSATFALALALATVITASGYEDLSPCDDRIGDLDEAAGYLGMTQESPTIADLLIAIAQEVRGVGIRWINPEHVFQQGRTAVVILQAPPKTRFEPPTVVYASDSPSSSPDLNPTWANDHGIAYWTWNIDDDTSTGAAEFRVQPSNDDEVVIVRFSVSRK